MGCRCSDIRKCSHDISQIEKIECILKFTDNINERVSSELVNLASNGISTFYCANEDELMTKEKKLNITVTDELDELKVKCSNKITELQEELSSMRREDIRYHSEEREKHHHHHDD